MKKTVFKALSLLMIMTMLSSSISLFQISADTQDDNAEKSKYIVITKDKNKYDELSDEYYEYISDDYDATNELQEENILVTEMSEEEANQLQSEEGVLLVEEDGLVKASTYENKEKTKATKKEKSKDDIDKEWNIKAVKADDVEKDAIIASEDKIKVAIIDSGLDMTDNIDVAGRINLIPGEEEVLPLFKDTTGHGTSIASIISANSDYEYSDVMGINDQVELYSAKVLDYTNSAPISRVIEGIYWAIEQDVDIINLSFGTAQNSEALYMAVRDAYDAGILIIAASGNSGGDIEYPAAYDEVMAVGSVDSTGTISDFCSTGEKMEVVAPGELIKTTGGFGGEIIVSGTSMAVPHVVGIASILWQKDKTKSADFIRQLINESANYLGDESVYGNGMVDLSYALEIYDEFAETYIAEIKGEDLNLFENDNEIENFSDVEYVEGLWLKSDHENMVSSYSYYLNSNQLYWVKYGAVYSDNCVYFTGMTANPWLHGYYGYSNNYLKSYDYLMLCSIYATTLSTTNTNLKADVDFVYRAFGVDDGKYILLGMAIHNGADIFAHSAKDNYDGKILTHTVSDATHKTGADSPKVLSARFVAAYRLAQKAIVRYINGNTYLPKYDILNAYNSANSSSYYTLVNWGTYWNY